MPSSSDVKPFVGYVETTLHALRLIYAARQGVIPRITRRLNDAERKSMIQSGAVFVFGVEESGIKRWTDGLLWSPSRIVGNFLVYREINERASGRGSHRRPYPIEDQSRGSNSGGYRDQRSFRYSSSHGATDPGTFKPNGLIKKTITVTVDGSDLHLISYYTSEDIRSGHLKRPNVRPDIMTLELPPSIFRLTNFRNPPKVEVGPDGKPRLVSDVHETESLGGVREAPYRLPESESPPLWPGELNGHRSFPTSGSMHISSTSLDSQHTHAHAHRFYSANGNGHDWTSQFEEALRPPSRGSFSSSPSSADGRGDALWSMPSMSQIGEDGNQTRERHDALNGLLDDGGTLPHESSWSALSPVSVGVEEQSRSPYDSAEPFLGHVRSPRTTFQEPGGCAPTTAANASNGRDHMTFGQISGAHQHHHGHHHPMAHLCNGSIGSFSSNSPLSSSSSPSSSSPSLSSASSLLHKFNPSEELSLQQQHTYRAWPSSSNGAHHSHSHSHSHGSPTDIFASQSHELAYSPDAFGARASAF